MTFNEARDIMFATFMSAWKGTGYPVVWTDVPADVPTSETTWARVVLRHADGGQGSLAGDTGVKRWKRAGTLFVQVFAPVGGGSSAGYNAAEAVVNAFQAAKDCVWYRNIRMNEIGASGAFEQINVLVDFTYDEVR